VDDLATGWTRLHHGIDPHRPRLLWWWLRGIWRMAQPLADIRVHPLALTCAGLVLAVDAPFFVRRLPWVALVFILLSVLADGLDGAVAIMRDRASRFGAVADKVADRIADVAFVVVIWRCGAPAVLTLITGAAVVLVEVVREVRGGRLLAALTVAERPSRATCAVLACLCLAVSPASWPATVCAAVLLSLSLIGLGQLAIAGRAS
jgi:CDP-diacylglycerol--glycerol-3-phosphate 3-phosphatidyltransferase